MMEFSGVHWPAVAIAALVAVMVAVVGGVLTEIGPWYHSLRFPAWKPPNWLFGPVWTVIFTLCVVSAGMAWPAARDDGARSGLVALFAVNAGLNIFWNILFFRWQRPDWALIETVALWLSVLALIVFIWPMAPVASLMLAPYLIWVSIAGLLNRAIVRLNGPFAGRPQARSI
jgi:translocator protein